MSISKILIGRTTDGREEFIDLRLANRHGLVTGATGTGKTVTLQVLAEGFSAAGVPVFATDIKGDLSGLAKRGSAQEALVNRAKEIGIEYVPDVFPVTLWDIFGEQGSPIKTTVEDVGALLLARLLNLTHTQNGVLSIAFMVARDRDMPIRTLEEFREVLKFVAENVQWVSARYGYVSASTIGIVLRELITLEQQGGASFFGDAAFDVNALVKVASEGKGVINLLAADRLMNRPQVYVVFLVWLLMKLFSELPEVGDPEKPKLVFFFDEAHLLFADAPKALLDTVERVVRLIRSKGVGVYFVTQSPIDIPDKVLAQLGNRVQHALRAFTPRDQKAVKTAADTFRPNPALDTYREILSLGKGEALVSVLEGNGTPTMVRKVLIRPPQAHVGILTQEERLEQLKAQSPAPETTEAAPQSRPAPEPIKRVVFTYERKLNHNWVMATAVAIGFLIGWILRGWLKL